MLKLYVAQISRFTCLSRNWSSGHMCTFIDVYMCATFFPAKLAAVSLLFFFFLSFPQAEARLAAKRAARAEAREIRMKELERQQKEVQVKNILSHAKL